jgi:predicted dehydrogenase
MRESSRLRTIVIFLAAATLLSVIGAEIYAYRVRAKAQELVESALRIGSTADAKREIEDMRKRFGNSFWEESDHMGGDHNYDAQVHNLSVARFLIVAPTVLNMGVAIRNGQLHYVILTMASGRGGFAPSAGVWIQEWFDPSQTSHMHVSEKADRGPPQSTSLRRYPMQYARKPLDYVRPALPKHEAAEALRNSFRMFGNGLG